MIYLVLVIFFIMLLSKIPIVFSIGLASLLYIVMSGEWNMLMSMPQRMIVTVDSFALLAIPLFVLVGELMNTGGITRRIIDFCRALIGHFRGGIAYVNILTSGFLSSIVGSSNAVAAITSKSIVPEMQKDGYTNEYASSVSAASSIMGPLIPPSMVLIIYGLAASVSIGELFLAGIIPGLLVLIGFSIIAFFYARKHDVPKKVKTPFKGILLSFVQTIPALMIPIVIIGGIMSGLFTATEAGAVGSILAFVLGVFIYRETDIKQLKYILIRTGIVTATILIIAAMANLFGWILTMEKIPQTVAETLISLSDNPYIILLLINILLLVIGMFIEPFAAIFIMVPVLLPVATGLGIDPVHFGLIMSFNLILGLITPPVGLTLFIVTGITKVPFLKLCRGLIPYLCVSLILLLIITFFPSLVLFLPNLFS